MAPRTSLLALAGLFASSSAPSDHNDVVLAKETDRYSHTFRAHETAIVTVSGDGDTDLDLYIYDENGHLIASDDDLSDDCVVTWTPRWTGAFTIKVVNRGRVSNVYTRETN